MKIRLPKRGNTSEPKTERVMAPPPKRKGEIRTTVVVDKDKKVTVDETIETVRTKRSHSMMVCRDVSSLKLSYGYNSVMCEVGTEIPMPCAPGDLQQASKNMDRVEALVQSKMQKKAAEMRKILRDLKRGQ